MLNPQHRPTRCLFRLLQCVEIQLRETLCPTTCKRCAPGQQTEFFINWNSRRSEGFDSAALWRLWFSELRRTTQPAFPQFNPLKSGLTVWHKSPGSASADINTTVCRDVNPRIRQNTLAWWVRDTGNFQFVPSSLRRWLCHTPDLNFLSYS